jgi:hypothetical protein
MEQKFFTNMRTAFVSQKISRNQHVNRALRFDMASDFTDSIQRSPASEADNFPRSQKVLSLL